MITSYPKPPKTKKKSKHISNPKPTAEDYCEFDEGGTVCGLPFAESHEIFGGPYRNFSIEDGLKKKLCGFNGMNHHAYVQHSPKATEYRKQLEREAQMKYEQTHTRDEFIKRYGYSRL